MDTNARILIVAGDADARAALAEPLRKQGHTVETAGGARALARYGEVAPDLVLLDVEASASSNGGAALLPRLVEQDADVAVVAMVAHGDVEAGVAALAAGASHYLTKPVNGTELSVVIARELARRRLRAEATAAARASQRTLPLREHRRQLGADAGGVPHGRAGGGGAHQRAAHRRAGDGQGADRRRDPREEPARARPLRSRHLPRARGAGARRRALRARARRAASAKGGSRKPRAAPSFSRRSTRSRSGCRSS